jgi:hypothetical protein
MLLHPCRDYALPIRTWGSTPDEVEKLMARQHQIRLKDFLADRWSDWFDGLKITHDADGDTMLEGAVRDQAALYDLIARTRDLHPHCRRATHDAHPI